MAYRDYSSGIRRFVVWAEKQTIEYEDMRGYHQLTSQTYDYLMGAWVFYIVALGFIRFNVNSKILHIQDMDQREGIA
jgi:hypothetical protein